LVKWKDKSFIHCTWVEEGDIQKAVKLPLISSTTRSKLRKVLAEAEIEARMVNPCLTSVMPDFRGHFHVLAFNMSTPVIFRDMRMHQRAVT